MLKRYYAAMGSEFGDENGMTLHVPFSLNKAKLSGLNMFYAVPVYPWLVNCSIPKMPTTLTCTPTHQCLRPGHKMESVQSA